MAFQKGRTKTGGRTSGILNKGTFEIKHACSIYGPGMIARLVRLTSNRDGHVAIKAIKLLLEYGYGKPHEQTQDNTTENSAQVKIYLPYNERHAHLEIGEKQREINGLIST